RGRRRDRVRARSLLARARGPLARGAAGLRTPSLAATGYVVGARLGTRRSCPRDVEHSSASLSLRPFPHLFPTPVMGEAVPDLRTVAQFVDATFAERRFDPFSTLVRITSVDGEGFDLGLLDLEGHNVTDALLGMAAPDDCWAIGVVTGAWAAPVGSHLRPSAHP